MARYAIVFVLIFSLVLSACGGGTSTPSGSNDSGSTGSTGQTPAASDGTATAEATEPPASAASGGEIIIGNNADAKVLDPHLSTDLYSSRVYSQIFETLVVTDFAGEYTPNLATDWTIEEGGKVWTFELREGVKFHDGTDMTAEDVKFSFERLKDPETQSPHRPDFAGIETIEVLDDHTVKVTLAEPSGVFISGLLSGYVVPKHLVEEQGEEFNKNPVGTGPFTFVEWVPDDRIVLEAFADYWGGAPKPERLVYRPIPETSTRVVELETGGINIMGELPGQEIERLEGEDGLTLDSIIGTNYRLLGFNTSREPFNDPLVRQAIAHAIDKQKLIDVVYPGVAIPAEGPIPPTSWAYDESFKGPQFDVEKAKELLAQSSRPDGFETTLMVSEGEIGQRDAVVIQSMLAAIGITVKIETVEWGTFLDRMTTSRDYDMLRVGWTVTGEPDSLLYNVFHSSSDQFNFTEYRNAEVDDLLDEGRRETDQAERIKIYQQAQEIIVEEVPMIFLYHERRVVAYTDDVQGFKPHPSGGFFFKTVYGADVGIDK